MNDTLRFSPDELQRCLFCRVEYRPAVEPHACEILDIGDAALKRLDGSLRYADSRGYIHVKVPNHPHATSNEWAYEHVIVMTAMLGRELDPNEIVHHRDENKGNNDPRNLELKDRAVHAQDHGKNPLTQRVGAANLLIECKCGCGQSLPTYDERGRPRQYIHGHNNRNYAEDSWTGCYRDNWKSLIVPEAFAHPAKYARGLIRRIYEHACERGWLQAGTRVVDPFGGVALGGFDAAWIGARWVGCELESKFVTLGNQNIAAWQARYGHLA